MGFTAAARSGFRNYVNFRGRALRSEFWWFFTFTFLMLFASLFVSGVMLFGAEEDPDPIVLLMPVLTALIFLPPFLSVMARRLHDKGLTAWLLLFGLVPFGQVALLILCALPGDEGPNAHGPNPAIAQPKPYAKSRIPTVRDED